MHQASSFFHSQEDHSVLRQPSQGEYPQGFCSSPQRDLRLDPSSIPLGDSPIKQLATGSQVLNSLFRDEDSDDEDDDAGPSYAAEEIIRSSIRESKPRVELKISNIGCDFHLMAHIKMQDLARKTTHVKYDRSKGHVEMQMRKPGCFAKVFSSGKVVLFVMQNEIQDEFYDRKMYKYYKDGALADPGHQNPYFNINPPFAEQKCVICARMLTRKIQKAVPNVKLIKFRINNIFGSCAFPFGVKIEEPELKSGMDWKLKKGDLMRGVETPVKGHVTLYHSGKMTFAGFESVQDLLAGLSFVYDNIFRFKGPIPEKPNRSKSLKRKTPYNEDLDVAYELEDLNFVDGDSEDDYE